MKSRINRILDFFNEKLKTVGDSEELSISEKELANLFAASERTFEREFKKELKTSYKQYFVRLRIEYAAYLLKNTQLTVAEVARKVGYTPSSLSKEFRKQFHTTPAQFRQNKLDAYIQHTQRSYEEEQRPTMHLIYSSHIGNYSELDTEEKECELFDKIEQLAKEEGILKQPVTYYGIAHDDADVREKEACRFYACVEVEKPITQMSKEINTLTIAAKKYAKYTHVGSYAGLDQLYEDVLCDLLFRPKDTFELDPEFTILERYLNDVQTTPEEQLITEVLFPISNKSLR